MGASKQLGKMMSSNSEGNKLQGSGRFAGSPIRFPSYAIGSRGKASFKSNPFVGDSLDKEDQKEEESTKNDLKPTKVNKDTDYDDTKKRLLELAKAEAIKMDDAREIERDIYIQSLPDSDDGRKIAEMFTKKQDRQKTVDKFTNQ